MKQNKYRDRKLHFRVLGAPSRPLSDLYHHLMRGSWRRLLLLWFLIYVVAIATFAILFWFGGDCITGAAPGSFSDSFWFSVQTFSTIGYGAMSPKTPWAHALVTIESFVGLTGVAMATALMYSKFARPSARIAFSEKVVICQRDGVPTLQVRIANERNNEVLHTTMRVSVLIEHVSEEGATLSRMETLSLERPQTPMFAMTWTAIHVLNASSPLHGLDASNVEERVVMLLATFEGTDDAYMQTVFARMIYEPEDIMFGHRFADVLSHRDDEILMNHEHLHSVLPEG